MDKQKSIEALQFFVTHLAEGAIVHKQQGLIFKAQGIAKLGQKYIGHFNEEMGWVEKFTERILDLGGDVKFEGMKSRDRSGTHREDWHPELAAVATVIYNALVPSINT